MAHLKSNDVEQGILQDYWSDTQFQLQSRLDADCQSTRHYHVHLDGRHSVCANYVLLSGRLLCSWKPIASEQIDFSQDKVAVKLTMADWLAIGKHTNTLRILNCPLVGGVDGPVVDTTIGTAVVSAGLIFRQDETIRVAEIFSGGFMGWGQTVSVLQHHSAPVQLRWALDNNPVCSRSFQAQHDAASIVTSTSNHSAELQKPGPFFLNASVHEMWWQAWIARQPVDIWRCSPPCQPWSTAGSQQGLHDQDGQLLLRLLSLMQAHQPGIVCVEEVAGFRKHAHYDTVRCIWEDIGYFEAWGEVVDLLDVAPQGRNRFLIVLVRKDKQEGLPRLQGEPVLPKRPTLSTFDCLLQLSPQLAKACDLEPAVLAMYLDPYFAPPSKSPGKASNISQRVITANGRAGTIMAQYHRQHLLPEASLARGGILGNLFRDSQGLRFLSGAEIALIHGCTLPFFIPQDDAQLMMLVGNSLSLPQAALPLTFAASCLQAEGKRADPHQAVIWTLQDRMRASSVSIAPLVDGWVLRKSAQVAQALHRLRPAVPWGQLPLFSPPGMQLFWVRDETETVPFLKPAGVSFPHTLDVLGIQFDEHSLEDLRPLLIHGTVSSELLQSPPQQCVQHLSCLSSAVRDSA